MTFTAYAFWMEPGCHRPVQDYTFHLPRELSLDSSLSDELPLEILFPILFHLGRVDP
jgi:hypothetical protein